MTLCLATTDREIQEIRDLQEVNLKDNVTANNRLSDGFLTAKYELDFLKAMNDLTPAILPSKTVGLLGMPWLPIGRYWRNILC